MLKKHERYNMFESIQWLEKEGRGNPAGLTLLTLSTCGFCKSARRYLEERGLAFRYLELNTISPEDKTAIKEEFRAKFERRPSFPTLIIEENRFLVGFNKEQWDEEIFPDNA
ncbi:MAG: hypothetical protein CSA76_04335 [Spirochaetales bacterium]|nr:MAG: hypothetical protein CSA76_04335 [Spirochaetales bacterium]